MSDTPQPQPAATIAEAKAALAEIQQRRGRVIEAVLVPGWYWWVMGAGIIAIGAARDSGNHVVPAIVIPVAALVMAALTRAMIPAMRRRVQVHRHAEPGPRGGAAIVGLILLVNGVTMGSAATLAASHVAYPVTIGCAFGAGILVIGGPLANGYLKRLMRYRAEQPMNGPSEVGSTP